VRLRLFDRALACHQVTPEEAKLYAASWLAMMEEADVLVEEVDVSEEAGGRAG
jgi:hypothetical protein